MPLGGVDTRFDLPWSEQDKIKRRLELKQRLKQDGIRVKYDPFKQLNGEIFQDPAIDRYMDIRKRGRLPNTPMRPATFYGLVATLIIPIWVMYQVAKWEWIPYMDGLKDGSIPYRDRKNRPFG